jgi:hypothetical protein
MQEASVLAPHTTAAAAARGMRSSCRMNSLARCIGCRCHQAGAAHQPSRTPPPPLSAGVCLSKRMGQLTSAMSWRSTTWTSLSELSLPAAVQRPVPLFPSLASCTGGDRIAQDGHVVRKCQIEKQLLEGYHNSKDGSQRRGRGTALAERPPLIVLVRLLLRCTDPDPRGVGCTGCDCTG